MLVVLVKSISKISSPCIQVCKLNYGSHLSVGEKLICIGCGRTKNEISEWSYANDDRKLEILERIKNG